MLQALHTLRNPQEIAHEIKDDELSPLKARVETEEERRSIQPRIKDQLGFIVEPTSLILGSLEFMVKDSILLWSNQSIYCTDLKKRKTNVGEEIPSKEFCHLFCIGARMIVRRPDAARSLDSR